MILIEGKYENLLVNPEFVHSVRYKKKSCAITVTYHRTEHTDTVNDVISDFDMLRIQFNQAEERKNEARLHAGKPAQPFQ